MQLMLHNLKQTIALLDAKRTKKKGCLNSETAFFYGFNVLILNLNHFKRNPYD